MDQAAPQEDDLSRFCILARGQKIFQCNFCTKIFFDLIASEIIAEGGIRLWLHKFVAKFFSFSCKCSDYRVRIFESLQGDVPNLLEMKHMKKYPTETQV